jgi:hypothetical protein
MSLKLRFDCASPARYQNTTFSIEQAMAKSA